MDFKPEYTETICGIKQRVIKSTNGKYILLSRETDNLWRVLVTTDRGHECLAKFRTIEQAKGFLQ
jgi:hypothetical protein